MPSGGRGLDSRGGEDDRGAARGRGAAGGSTRAIRLGRARGRLLPLPRGGQGVRAAPARGRSGPRALASSGISAAAASTTDATTRLFVESRYELYSKCVIT